VEETQYMMRMVLVMGSEGISLILGSLGTLFIIAYYNNKINRGARRWTSFCHKSSELEICCLKDESMIKTIVGHEYCVDE